MIDYDQLPDFAGHDGHGQAPAVFYGIASPWGDIWNVTKIIDIPEGVKAALKETEARAIRCLLNGCPDGLASYNDPPRPSWQGYPGYYYRPSNFLKGETID